MTPAGTSTSLTYVQNKRDDNTHTHLGRINASGIDRMTRMTRPDCAVMCHLINTHTHTHKKRKKPQTSVDAKWETNGGDLVSRWKEKKM